MVVGLPVELIITVIIGGIMLALISVLGIAIQRKLGGGRPRTAQEERMLAESQMHSNHNNHPFN